MSWGAVIVGGAALVGSVASSRAQSKATSNAAAASGDATALAVDEERRQFDQLQELFRPFVEGGTSAFGAQLDLIGVNGEEAQELAIDNIRNGVEYNTLVEQGEEAILQNASATGGLRGGNTQKALSEFRPQLLAQLINDQFSRLGGLSAVGQASAGQQAVQSGNTSSNISSLLAGQGANEAALAIAQGQNQADLIGNIAGSIGYVAGNKF